MAKKLNRDQRRTYRTRNKLRRVNIEQNAVREERPRLSVYRSNRQIYVQLIDDAAGKTIVAASSKDKDLKVKKSWDTEAAREVGKLIAEKAKKAGVTRVQFDRGGYRYHGRVKALADAAREGGLDF